MSASRLSISKCEVGSSRISTCGFACAIRPRSKRTFSPPLGTDLVCEIVVAEPRAARGVLLGPNERPLGGWRVCAEFTDRALEPVVVGDDGAFVLWGTGAGPLQIVAGTGEGVDPSMRPMHTFGPIVPGSERLRLVMPESSMPVS